MPKYLPAGFKVLTGELRTASSDLDTVHTHLSQALHGVSGWAGTARASTIMEDGVYGMASPGAAFEAYWHLISIGTQTLVEDAHDLARALTTAAGAYDAAEQSISHSATAPSRPATPAPQGHGRTTIR